jgi:DNA-binding NtrC family response regulator
MKKRVLIIDDDEFILLGLSRAMVTAAAAAEVLTARHGRQAVEILNACPVNVIVTDLGMPVMNGYELVEYVNKNFPLIPVYVMTGEYIPDVKPRFRPGVVVDFISKPFSFRQFAADISARLEAVELRSMA